MEQEAPKKSKYDFLSGGSTPPAAPQEPPKLKERPWTVGGFTENALNDVWDFAKGLYSLVPSLSKRVKEIAKNPGQYQKDVALLFSGDYGKETGKFLVDAATENYRKHGAGVVYHKPFSTLADAVSLLAGGGSIIKNAGKLAKAAEGAQIAGQVSKADRLIKAGQFLETLPSRLARKAVDKGVYGVSGGKLDLAKRREFLDIKRAEQARSIVEMENDMKAVGSKIAALSDEEAALWHKARTQGASAAEMMTSPKTLEALESYRVLVKKWQTELKARNLLDDATIDDVILKKLAAEKYKSIKEDALLKAKLDFDAAEIKPVYGPAIHMKGKKGVDLEKVFEGLITGPEKRMAGKVDSLEKYTGAAGAITDPRQYVPRAIHAFRDLEARLRTSGRLLERKALITGGAEGLSSDIIPEGVYRKYYQDRVRAEALKTVTDPTIKRLLKYEYTEANYPLQNIYDKFMRFWAKQGTVFNPGWYAGNYVGNAFFSALFGGSMGQGRKLIKAGAAPYEALAKSGMGPADLARAVPSLTDRAADLGNVLDRMARAGMIAKTSVREMKEAGLSFESLGSTMEDFLRSTDKYGEMEVRLQLAREWLARNKAEMVDIDKKIALLEKAEGQIAKRVHELDFRARYKATENLEKANERMILEGDIRKADDPSNWERMKAAEVEIPVGAGASSAFETEMGKLRKVYAKREALVEKRRAVLADLTNDYMKTGRLDAAIPGIRQQAQFVQRGIDRSNAFFGDYLGLDGFERRFLSRLIPFYPWTKAMGMLAFRLPFLAPGATFAWNRYAAVMADMVNDERLPDWTQGYLPVFVTKDGNTVWMKLTSYSPFEGLRSSKIGEVPIPSGMAFWERNPLISLGIRLVGGKTIFDKSSLPYGEQMVNMHDGSVVEFGQDGKLRKTIPQTPLVSGIAHMFPLTQLAENLLTPFWANKYDSVGLPKPVYNSDGSYRHPKELQDRISRLVGVNLMTRKPQDLINSERRKAAEAVEQYKRQLKRADPEERQQIVDALRDYARGTGYRKYASY